MNLWGADAGSDSAAKTEEATADAAITPAVPISTSRRDAIEVDGPESVGMVLLNK
jgi:hypothetical protein